MVSLERLQGQLLLWLDLLVSHLLHFTCEYHFRLGRAVDTAGLDGDDHTTTGLEEHVGVQSDDTGLVGLGNIGEDDVDHGDEHAVAQRVSGVLDNGDNVGAVSRHADQVTAGTVGEFDTVDVASRSDDVSNVGDGGTAGGTKVEHLQAGAHVDFIQTTEDTGSQLTTEGVPDTVFGLGHGTIIFRSSLNRNALLAVDSLAGGQVLGNEQIFFSTAGNEYTSVTVGFLVPCEQTIDSNDFEYSQ